MIGNNRSDALPNSRREERVQVGNWDDDKKIIQKMKLCKKFYNGEQCPYDEKCSFLHEVPAKFRADSWKSKECSPKSFGDASDNMECNSGVTKQPKWQNTGSFPFGDDCHFAPDEAVWLLLLVGSNSIPCQLMVRFFAYAKLREITVDKKELEDARWFSREDVREALTLAEYKKAQKTAASKVEQMCKGVEKRRSMAADFNVESGELAPIFVPGPFAMAHHLISSCAFSDQNAH